VYRTLLGNELTEKKVTRSGSKDASLLGSASMVGVLKGEK